MLLPLKKKRRKEEGLDYNKIIKISSFINKLGCRTHKLTSFFQRIRKKDSLIGKSNFFSSVVFLLLVKSAVLCCCCCLSVCVCVCVYSPFFLLFHFFVYVCVFAYLIISILSLFFFCTARFIFLFFFCVCVEFFFSLPYFIGVHCTLCIYTHKA